MEQFLNVLEVSWKIGHLHLKSGKNPDFITIVKGDSSTFKTEVLDSVQKAPTWQPWHPLGQLQQSKLQSLKVLLFPHQTFL